MYDVVALIPQLQSTPQETVGRFSANFGGLSKGEVKYTLSRVSTVLSLPAACRYRDMTSDRKQ